MKKTLRTFGTVIFLTIFTFTACQKDTEPYIEEAKTLSNQDYGAMIMHIKQGMDIILLESKPAEMSLEEYKHQLLAGELSISQDQQDRILQVAEPLAKYGNNLAQLNRIEIDENDLGAQFALGAIHSQGMGLNAKVEISSPPIAVRSSTDETTTTPDENMDDVIVNGTLTWGEVGDCALAALGFDAAWAVAPSVGTSWTLAAMRTTFTNIAKRALGPVGVAIAVVSFTACLFKEGADFAVNEDDSDMYTSEPEEDPNTDTPELEDDPNTPESEDDPNTDTTEPE